MGKHTVVHYKILQDDRLSLKEFGLLIKLLSLPDDWEFNENELMQVFSQNGKSSIRTGLKALEEYGYLKRVQLRNENGQMSGVEWHLTEEAW